MFANNNDRIGRILEGCAEAQRSQTGKTFYREDINTYVAMSGCGVDPERNIPDAEAILKLTRIALNTFVMLNGGVVINDINWQPTASEAQAIMQMKYSFENDYSLTTSSLSNKIWQILPTVQSFMGIPYVNGNTTIYQGSRINTLDIAVNSGANDVILIKNDLTGRICLRRQVHFLEAGVGPGFDILGGVEVRMSQTPDIRGTINLVLNGLVVPAVEGVWFEVTGGFSVNTLVPFVGILTLEYELFSCRNVGGNAPVYALATNPVISRDFVSIVPLLENAPESKRETLNRFCAAYGLNLADINKIGRFGNIHDSNVLSRILDAFMMIGLDRR